jgi:hypothetical protein
MLDARRCEKGEGSCGGVFHKRVDGERDSSVTWHRIFDLVAIVMLGLGAMALLYACT